MQKNYVQEILSIIHSGLPKAELAEKLSDYHEKDLADALESLTPAERQSLYSILGVDTVAEIFTYLDDAEPYLKDADQIIFGPVSNADGSRMAFIIKDDTIIELLERK